MSIEFCGSLLVFCIGFLYNQLRSPLTVCAGCSLLVFSMGSMYALFFIGICLGILRAQGFFIRLQDRQFNPIYVGFGIVLLLVTNAYKTYIPLLTPYQKDILLATAGVGLCYASRDLISFMRSQFSVFLGRISFPLYFMQFPVLISFTSYSIIKLHQYFPTGITMPVIAITSSLIFMVAVAVATEYLEMRYLKHLDQWIPRLLK